MNISQNSILIFPSTAPWQKRLAAKFGFSSKEGLFWFLTSLLIFVIQILLLEIFGNTTRGLPAFGIYCFIIFYAGVFPVFVWEKFCSSFSVLHKIYSDPQNDFELWYAKQLKDIFSFKKGMFSFVVIGSLATISLVIVSKNFTYSSSWFGNPYSDYFAYAAFLVWSLVVSYHVVLTSGMIFFTYDLAKLSMRVIIYEYPLSGLKIIGRLYFFIFMNFAVGLGLIYCGIYLSPLPFGPLMLFWMMFAGVIVLIIFLIPQFRLHKIIKESKGIEILKLSEYLDDAMKRMTSNPSRENIDRFEKLINAVEKINNLNEWPFTAKSLFSLISTIVLPIIAIIIDLY